MSVAYRHHMTRAADCGASHVRGERTLRVRSMYVPYVAPALPMRCARTSVHALLLRCSCMHCLRPAHALLMRCTHVLISRALRVHRACGPLLHSSCTARAIQMHTACSVSTCSYACTCTCTCTCTARVLPALTICAARALHIHCACSRVHRAPIKHTLRIRSRALHVHCSCTTNCTATCRTLHVRCPRATLTCALSMRGTSTCTGTALHSTCIPRELFMRSTSASPARLLTLCTRMRCSRTTPALLK